MGRCRFLAILGSASLAGSVGRRSTDPLIPASSKKRRVPHENVTVYTEAPEYPDRASNPSLASTIDSVAAHEEEYVYNEVIGEVDDTEIDLPRPIRRRSTVEGS